jgi:hypothetical protein
MWTKVVESGVIGGDRRGLRRVAGLEWDARRERQHPDSFEGQKAHFRLRNLCFAAITQLESTKRDG